ncbi:hypothetical protein PAAG_05922 [Paracoccidioides lutzii Pb01]|uniref:Uncharacterized protein n=1 Tax=Paracoccidioides lutzii (strain ATCC MYA-826 / Pb01) TaxID=502779 RepID=C1H581_PARBA|nr:hypothetical protein PAAG_05922 [Paracoccidioides lutzii Pb01]EEH34875.1 hypothetical protein PAAG_05922 [Paracoccidioides lutzii Pb01]
MSVLRRKPVELNSETGHVDFLLDGQHRTRLMFLLQHHNPGAALLIEAIGVSCRYCPRVSAQPPAGFQFLFDK